MPVCSLIGCRSSTKPEKFISSDDEWREAKHVIKQNHAVAKKFQRELILFKHTGATSPRLLKQNILEHSVTFMAADSQETQNQNQSPQKNNDNQVYRRKMIRGSLENKLVHICQQIENQVQDYDHPINALRRLFMKHFVKRFQEFLPQQDESSKEESKRQESFTIKLFRKIVSLKDKDPKNDSIQDESKVNSLVQSFIGRTTIHKESLFKQAIKYAQGFVFIVKFLITKFYLSLVNLEDLKTLQEDFLRISTNMVVQQQIFAILLQFCRVDSYQMDKDLREPQQYRINSYLSLNSGSPILEEIKKLLGQKQQKEIKISIKGIGEQELDINLKQDIEQILENAQCSPEFSFQYMKMLREKLYKDPFYRSIRYVQNVFLSSKPPLKKLIELNNLKKIIKDEIIKFWTSLTPDPEDILQHLNRDEYQTIFIYILTKIQVPDLISQFKILDSFISKYIRSAGDGSQISETFIMLESSVYWLQALPTDKIQGEELGDSLIKIRENLNSLVGGTPYEYNPDHDWDPFHITMTQNCISSIFDVIFRRRHQVQQFEEQIPKEEEWQYVVNKVYPQLEKNKPWIESYLKDSETVVKETAQDVRRFQREFQLFLKTQHIKGSTSHHDSYLSSINRETTIRNEVPITFEVIDQDFSQQYKMVQKDLTEEQCIIYQEIEHQVTQNNHPITLYCQLFEDHFADQYNRYIASIKDGSINKTVLFRQLADENRELQANHILNIIHNDSMDEDVKEAELLRKDEITVFSQAMSEVKHFAFVVRTIIFKFYVPFLKKSDLQALVEDLLRLSINKVLSYQVYKILLCLCRVETFSDDKDLRHKYNVLGRYAPEDFGIDPYLTLNSQSPVVEEISKKVSMLNQQSTDTIQVEEKSLAEISKDYSTIERDQNKYIESYFNDMEFINMDEDFKKRKISDDIKNKMNHKPYRECVIKFRQIMLEHNSPMVKLFALQDLKDLIKKEIIKFWDSFGANGRDIVGQKFSRDEYISILIFIMVKAQVPDLVSQLRIISCFASPYVQESNDGSLTSETFNMIETCIKWFQGLQASKLYEEGYLLKATIRIREKLNTQGYQLVKELSESFDPFAVTQYGGSWAGRGSYFVK